MMKVMIVDDEPAMLLAIKRMLSAIDGVEMVGGFQRAAQALDYARVGEVDLAILDIKIAEDDGLALARSLHMIRPELDIVFTTSHSQYALPAYDVYPLDYIVKPVSSMRLTQTIARAQKKRGAAAGEAAKSETAKSETAKSRVAENGAAGSASELPNALTARELEVLRGIAAGQTNEAIAELLQISLSTVKVHTRHIFNKLEVHNRVSAVNRAQQLSLLG